MNELRVRTVGLAAVIAALAGFLGGLIAERAAAGVPSLGWVSVVSLATVAIALLVAGIWVRRTQRRTARRAISGLAALRVLVLAQAGAYAGALLGGWHAGIVVQVAAGGGFGSPTSWNAVAVVAGALILVAVGFVVQSMCRLPPEDPESEPNGGTEGVEGAR